MGARARRFGVPSYAPVQPLGADGSSRPRLAKGDEAFQPSPVHGMQVALEADLAPPEIKKWHPLARVGFIVGFCGCCWTLIAMGIMAAT